MVKHSQKLRICKECGQIVQHVNDASLLRYIVDQQHRHKRTVANLKSIPLSIMFERCGSAKHLSPVGSPHCIGSPRYTQYLDEGGALDPEGAYSDKECAFVKQGMEILLALTQ